MNLTDESRSRLDQLPMKAVIPSTVELACDNHTHHLQAELRRTFKSAIVIVHRVDNTRIRPTISWRCPNR